jgi:SAM-dependent methyltransferase
MKICLVCGQQFATDDWACPACRHMPEWRDGYLAFAPGLADTNDGFHAEYFARLATLEEHHFWFRARNRLLLWAVQRYFPDAKSVLEIGCGTGFVLAGIARAFPAMDLSGSDIFAEGLAFAAQRVPGADLFQMDACRIPFVSAFDLAGAFDVLEHIEDDRTVLQQMFQAVRPGGGILLTVPQHMWLWSAMDDYSYHKRRYNRAELVAKVECAGFEPLHVTSFVSLLLPLMLLSRIMQRVVATDWDPWAELQVAGYTNAVAELIMGFERRVIARIRSLPVGGSLLIVARRPEV